MRNWLLWYLQIFPRPLIACVPHELVLACTNSKAYGVANTFCCEIICLEDHRVRVDDKFSSWLLVIKGVLQASVLGPLFLNVFMNSLFYFLKGECINAYADDVSDRDPLRLEKRLLCQILEGDDWFGMNGMITNLDKYQGMITYPSVFRWKIALTSHEWT